jgi:hypothetical protein
MIKFGTDGWRALIAHDFTFDNLKKVAYALACYLKEQGKDKTTAFSPNHLPVRPPRFVPAPGSKPFFPLMLSPPQPCHWQSKSSAWMPG